MGAFSWLTADTQESIPNVYSGHKNVGKKVYLLLPNGDKIEEIEYKGYGEFGGQDAYEILAEQNFSHMDKFSTLNKEKKRILGIAIGAEDWLVKDGVVYVSPIETSIIPFLKAILLDETDIQVLPDDVNWDGFESKTISELGASHYKPLKFSFNPEAKYDELPASQDCPHQGHFY